MNERLWDISVVSEVRIFGNDPEMADMDNPRGLVYGDVFIIQAINPDGHRCQLDTMLTNREEAERFSLTFDSESPNWGPDWIPVTPVYGSPAYVDLDAEAELIEWERQYQC